MSESEEVKSFLAVTDRRFTALESQVGDLNKALNHIVVTIEKVSNKQDAQDFKIANNKPRDYKEIMTSVGITISAIAGLFYFGMYWLNQETRPINAHIADMRQELNRTSLLGYEMRLQAIKEQAELDKRTALLEQYLKLSGHKNVLPQVTY